MLPPLNTQTGNRDTEKPSEALLGPAGTSALFHERRVNQGQGCRERTVRVLSAHPVLSGASGSEGGWAGAWPSLRKQPHGSPNCGGYSLNFTFLTFSFSTSFLVLGSGKSGKTYTVTILSWSERRKDFTVAERKHWLTCGLINHAHIYAFLGVDLYGIFPFSRREFNL